MRFTEILDVAAGQGGAIAPTAIPSNLTYFIVDAEDTARVTTSGGAVSSYAEIITGTTFVQATGALQPSHNLTAFNSRPAFVFDGARTLRNTTAVATLGWPTGGAFEFWACVEWTGGNLADGIQGYIFNYPTNAVNTGILVSIVNNGASDNTMRARVRVGQGASSVDVINTTGAAITGRHIIRVVSDGSTIRLDVDGIVGTPVACVAGGWTGGPRHTIAGSSATTATNMFIGKINYLGFYKPLSALYSDGLYRTLLTRQG